MLSREQGVVGGCRRLQGRAVVDSTNVSMFEDEQSSLERDVVATSLQ